MQKLYIIINIIYIKIIQFLHVFLCIFQNITIIIYNTNFIIISKMF